MGYMRHHAIIVTSCKEESIQAAHQRAEAIFDRGWNWVSPLSPKTINGYRSFFVAPDGSKEGWEESDYADGSRDQFITWMDTQRFEDRSSYLEWVEVQYADDNRETKICRDSDNPSPSGGNIQHGT